MPSLAVINKSGDPDVADTLPWALRAINQQLAEHFIPAYQNFLLRMRTDDSHWPVAAYASLDGLNPLDFDPCYVLDKVPAGELGSHAAVLGFVTARAEAQGADTSVTLSHEAIEWRADRPCNIWIRQPDGSGLAFEPGDPVERSDYLMDVDWLGIRKSVRVSNFALPSWFIPGSEGPWDYLGLLDGPGKLLRGCHVVRQEMDRAVTTSYGRGTSPADMVRAIGHPLSRTYRRGNATGGFVDFTPPR